MKINILFIINDKYIHGFQTIYDECKNNDMFNITIATCPSIQRYNTNYISSSEIKKYLNKHNIDCIDLYDEKTKKYVDLRKYNPDYIFVMTHYDDYRPKEYSAKNLSKIAKFCSIEYGNNVMKYTGIYEYMNRNIFYRYAYKFFVINDLEKDATENKEIREKFKSIGSIKLDQYLFYNKKPTGWKMIFPKSKKNNTRVIYKPRWTLAEDSTVLKYISSFYKYLKENKDIELIMLIHPLLFSNLKYTNNEKEFYNSFNKLKKLPNFNYYDDYDYLNLLLDSDVLIADVVSSVFAEFSPTKNPIIFIPAKVELTVFIKKILEKQYEAKNFNEIVKHLETIKKKKDIFFRNSNRRLDTSIITPPQKNISSAKYLLNYLKEDYIKSNMNKNYYLDYIEKQSNEIQKISKTLGIVENDSIEIVVSSIKELLNKNKELRKANQKISKKLNKKMKIKQIIKKILRIH